MKLSNLKKTQEIITMLETCKDFLDLYVEDTGVSYDIGTIIEELQAIVEDEA